MAPSTIIHLMRHAQHDVSTQRLSITGIIQALVFARDFKGAPNITHIFCSKVIRCKQTANIALREVIARGIPVVEVEALSDNREIGISFIWNYIDLGVNNEVMMVTQGSVLRTLLALHKVVYEQQDFPNAELRSYFLFHFHRLDDDNLQELRQRRPRTYSPLPRSTVFKRKAVTVMKFLVKYVPISWFCISMLALPIYFLAGLVRSQ